MATITIKNVTTSAIYLRDLQDSIDAGETSTFNRSIGELTGMTGLSAEIAAGRIQLVSKAVPPEEQAWLGQVSTGPMTFFVATNGSDSNDGLTAATPLKTVTAALNRFPMTVRQGAVGVVNVAAGSYDERIFVPPLNVVDSVTVRGAPMAPTTPAQGLASGTFDANFGAQDFPSRALMTGAGWAVGGLRGGWFLEIMDGAGVGLLLPIVNNTATTLDFAVAVNTSTYNLQGRQWRLVKPTTLFTRASEENFVAYGGAGTSTSPIGSSTGAVIFQRMQFTRGSSVAARISTGAFVGLSQCAVLDSGGGGSQMITVFGGAIFRAEDTLLFRSAPSNTIMVNATAFGRFLGTRCGIFGGNIGVNGSQCNITVSSMFVSNCGLGFVATEGSQLQATALWNDGGQAAVCVSVGSRVNLVTGIIRNCTIFGVGVGLTSQTVTTAVMSGAFAQLFNTRVDTCVRGIAFGQGASVLLTGASTVIANNSAFGVDMGPTLRSGQNLLTLEGTVSMSGNGADLSVDGTATSTIAAFRALTPKRIVDAVSTFNRIVEVV